MNEEDKKSTYKVSDIASQIAAMILKKQYLEGKEITIPSLGITIKRKEKSNDE